MVYYADKWCPWCASLAPKSISGGTGDGACDGGKNASGGDFKRARDALAAGLPVPAHRPRKYRARVFFLASGFAFGTATLRAMAHRVEGAALTPPIPQLIFQSGFCHWSLCEDEGEGWNS